MIDQFFTAYGLLRYCRIGPRDATERLFPSSADALLHFLRLTVPLLTDLAFGSCFSIFFFFSFSFMFFAFCISTLTSQREKLSIDSVFHHPSRVLGTVGK